MKIPDLNHLPRVPVDLPRFFDEEEAKALAQGPVDQFGMLIIWYLQKRLEDRDRMIDNTPCMNDEDLLNDIRAQLGARHQLREILSVISAAQAYVNTGGNRP